MKNVKGILVVLGIIALLAGMLLIVGCSTKSYKSYYADGQVKEEWEKEGFIDWSAGDNKQMPFSNISVNGVKAGLPDLKK